MVHTKEKLLIEITGATWKSAYDALKQAKQEAGVGATDDDIITLACRLLTSITQKEEFTRQGKVIKERRQKLAMYKEAHERLLVQQPHSFLMGQDGIANYDLDEMPPILSSHGVSMDIWKHMHASTKKVVQRLKIVNSLEGECWGESLKIDQQQDAKDHLERSILISNLLAQLNFMLNPHGILVQIPMHELYWESATCMKKEKTLGGWRVTNKKTKFVYLTVGFQTLDDLLLTNPRAADNVSLGPKWKNYMMTKSG